MASEVSSEVDHITTLWLDFLWDTLTDRLTSLVQFTLAEKMLK